MPFSKNLLENIRKYLSLIILIDEPDHSDEYLKRLQTSLTMAKEAEKAIKTIIADLEEAIKEEKAKPKKADKPKKEVSTTNMSIPINDEKVIANALKAGEEAETAKEKIGAKIKERGKKIFVSLKEKIKKTQKHYHDEDKRIEEER